MTDGYLQRCENTLAGGETALEALLELPAVSWPRPLAADA
jgi:hypothetical protein